MNVHGTPTLIHVVNSDRAELYLSCQMSQNTAELKGRISYINSKQWVLPAYKYNTRGKVHVVKILGMKFSMKKI